MQGIEKELQLLGIFERGKEAEIIPHLLHLYNRTLEEKNSAQVLCEKLSSKIRSLLDKNRCLCVEYAEQGTLVSNLKKDLFCATEQVKASSHQLAQLNKENSMERKKFKQWAHVQRVCLQEAHKQIRCLKEELRRKTVIASKKPREAFVDVGFLRIQNNYLSHGGISDGDKAVQEDVLAKGIRRMDTAQRLLIEENASIWISIQMINISVQQAVHALRLHIYEKELDPVNFHDNQEIEENTKWIPQIIQNTLDQCLQLNKLVAVMQKSFPNDKAAIEDVTVSHYSQCFKNFEESLQKAQHIICDIKE